MSGGWSWPTLFLLGAYHGINPGMGWLFAVALGMQEKRSWAVVRSLAPITLGHALAIGVVIGLAGLARIVVPLNYLKLTVAAGLILLGWRHQHRRQRTVRGAAVEVRRIVRR